VPVIHGIQKPWLALANRDPRRAFQAAEKRLEELSRATFAELKAKGWLNLQPAEEVTLPNQLTV